jgi:hypothetical protein
MLRRLVSQLCIIIAVALCFGLLFNAVSLNFYLGIAFGIVIQFAAFRAFSYGLEVYATLKNKQLENERIKEFSYQGLAVECPCSKKIKDFVPVKLNSSNYYKCKECNKTVGIVLAAETALVTEPIANTATGDVEAIFNKLVEQQVKQKAL